jgi:AcrR family transcriptional regulator
MSSGDPETRKRILDKTWLLMEKRKGQGVSVSDIARAAGVSRQAVYLHFPSRAELLVATVRYADQVNNIDARLRALNTAANATEVLEAYVDFWGNYIPEIYGLAKALLSVRDTDKAAATAWNDRMKVLRQGCREVMNCLIRDGCLAPQWKASEAADALWALTSITVWEDLTRECGWSTSEYVSRMKVALKRTFVSEQRR